MDIVPTYVAPTAGAGCCSICRSGHKEPPRPRKLDQGRKLSEGAASVAETCSARTTAIILPREPQVAEDGKRCSPKRSFTVTLVVARAGSLLLFA